MIEGGYILLSRHILKSDLFQNHNAYILFSYLLLSAMHQPAKFAINKQFVEVLRGQLVTGRRAMSSGTGLSENVIRSSINYLKSTSRLTIQSTSHYSIITICNYDLYQKPDNYNHQQINQPINQPITSQSPANHQPATTYNNNKNIRIKELNTKNIAPEVLKNPPKPPTQKITWNKTTQEFENISKEIIIGWKEAYPAVDIQNEILKAREWVRCDPKRIKTQWRAFFTRWLSKTQDGYHGNNGNGLRIIQKPRVDLEAEKKMLLDQKLKYESEMGVLNGN